MGTRNSQSVLARMMRARLIVMVGGAILLFLAFAYARAYYQDYTIRQEIRTLEHEVRSLEKKKLESLELLDYVTSDRFVEEVARTELNMKEEGEHVVVIQTTSSRQLRPTAYHEESLNNPMKWWYYITGTSLPTAP